MSEGFFPPTLASYFWPTVVSLLVLVVPIRKVLTIHSASIENGTARVRPNPDDGGSFVIWPNLAIETSQACRCRAFNVRHLVALSRA